MEMIPFLKITEKKETFRDHCEDNIKKKHKDIRNTVIEVTKIDGSKAKKIKLQHLSVISCGAGSVKKNKVPPLKVVHNNTK